MKIMKRLPVFLLLSAMLPLAAGTSPYEKPTPVRIVTASDRLLERNWKHAGLPVPPEASDSVLIRRLYLILQGRLPSAEEAQSFTASTGPDKYEALVNRLLTEEAFADFQAMYFCDALRVKSEFPINLWPNAVYGYQRRIRAFLAANEPYDRFVRTLLTSSGSNFRVPEANFYRAAANRTPAGIARAAADTFLGALPEEEMRQLATHFRTIRFKDTKEWKEEIVYREDGSDGSEAADAVIRHPAFAPAAVNRLWTQIFGSELAGVNPELLAHLAQEFQKDYDYRRLCREIVLSAAFRAAPFQGGNAEKQFASFPVRRLGAEVLDDAICDLTGTGRNYSSVIPEPFSFLPPDARTVTLADGSVSSSFLILFGRPARDSGLPSERNNTVNTKQRLWLFNSGELYRKLGRIPGRQELKKLPFPKKIEQLYWIFYSRPPTEEERKTVLDSFNALPKGREKWRFPQDLCWVLINSGEFLHLH